VAALTPNRRKPSEFFDFLTDAIFIRLNPLLSE